jgi:hypothetical protein
VSTIKLDTPAAPPLVTKLTLIVTLAPVVLVAVNLSMMALQLVAVYCVVWAFSACFGGISTLIDTVMVYSKRRILFGMYCVISQFVPSDTSVAESPELAKRMDVPAAPPASGTTFDDAETSARTW